MIELLLEHALQAFFFGVGVVCVSSLAIAIALLLGGLR